MPLMADPNRPVTGYPAPAPNGNVPPPSNTSYPYAAPPPAYYTHQQQYYPHNYQPDPYAAQRSTFLRRIFAFIIAAVIITGTVLFIIWLVLRPRLPEFRVDSLSVSNFNLSSTSLSATFDLGFTARNPNKKISLAYDDVEAKVFYQDAALSETTLAPFTQSIRNETAMRADFAASGTYVDKGTVDGINGERNDRGNIGFNVRMFMEIRFRAGVWKGRRRFLRVFCGVLPVAVPSNRTNGTLLAGPRQCRVVL